MFLALMSQNFKGGVLMKLFYLIVFFLIGQSSYQPANAMEGRDLLNEVRAEAQRQFSQYPIPINKPGSDLYYDAGVASLMMSSLATDPEEKDQRDLEAISCFLSSAEVYKNRHAFDALSKMHAQGRGVSPDEKAAQMFAEAASQTESKDLWGFSINCLQKAYSYSEDQRSMATKEFIKYYDGVIQLARKQDPKGVQELIRIRREGVPGFLEPKSPEKVRILENYFGV